MITKTRQFKHLITCKRSAFTLAEVLITLGVIGVVAAVTLPALLTNVQDRVRQEQVRTVKYKFTKATDKMNSLGKIGEYETTMKFVEELKKHLSIAKVCDSSNLDECWASKTITAYSGNSTTPRTVNVNTITNGEQLKALALGTKETQTVGIVTGDGVPMILVYNTHCSGFDETKQYTWSVENGKPVTNATTNCVSAIFDINGAKGPNKIGTDVRTLNSIFGSVSLTSISLNADKCNAVKLKLGIKYCGGVGMDFWAGAVLNCDDLGLHLPNLATLANIANARYGTNQINSYTQYFNSSYKGKDGTGDCINWMKDKGWLSTYLYSKSDNIICNANTQTSETSSIGEAINGDYWANSEFSETSAFHRTIGPTMSMWSGSGSRNGQGVKILCVGD